MNIEINGTDAWDIEIRMYLNSIPESNRAAIVKMGLLGFFRQNYPAPSGIHNPIMQPTISASTAATPEPTNIERPESTTPQPTIAASTAATPEPTNIERPESTTPQPTNKINNVPVTESPKDKVSEAPHHMQNSSLEKALIPDSALAKMKEEKRKSRQKRLANR